MSTELLELVIMLAVSMPLFIQWHKKGVERYRKYDRLAFWNSLSDEDKESADWYMEAEL